MLVHKTKWNKVLLKNIKSVLYYNLNYFCQLMTCTVTCFCSFTYLETIQNRIYFGLLFHLKLILSHSIVLQKCAFKFSFSCLGYAGSITPCFSVLVRVQGWVSVNRYHATWWTQIFVMKPCSMIAPLPCSAHKTITITTGGAQCNYTLS